MDKLPSDFIRLSQVDQLLLPDHFYLDQNDRCYFFIEYTSGESFNYSDGNRLISNLKKSVLKRGRPEYHYKNEAINQCSAWLRSVYDSSTLWKNSTFVPVPSSKHMGDPEYDDRMVRICQGISSQADVRSIVFQTETTVASHTVKDGERLKLEQLLNIYRINEELCNPIPQRIIIVDDMLTTGTHFKAMQHTLQRRFPGIPIEGIFIARRRIVPDKNNVEFNKLLHAIYPNP